MKVAPGHETHLEAEPAELIKEMRPPRVRIVCSCGAYTRDYLHRSVVGRYTDLHAQQIANEIALSAPVHLVVAGAELILRSQFGSVSQIQRHLQVSATQAAAVMDDLERVGVVGPELGTLARDVLVERDRLDEVLTRIEAAA